MRRLACLAAAMVLASSLALAQPALYQAQPAEAPEGSPAPGPAWLPRGAAELQALDKINARSQVFTVRDGASVRFGTLSITVQSCVVRPPDRPPDAAAFLVVADATPDQPSFRGWMFLSDPAVSMLEHPIYDLRVLGCVS